MNGIFWKYLCDLHTEDWRCAVDGQELVLTGTVTEVRRPGISMRGDLTQGLHQSQNERVTLLVDGAEPLWAELRIANTQGWAVGEKVTISIVSVERKQTPQAA